MQSYRWLFYAVNGLGLGHVTRTIALARQIRTLMPESQFLILTTSEASGLFWQEGFASVKVPSRMAAKQSGLRYGTYNQLLHSLVVNTIGAYHPHIMVIDTFPAGSAKELLPVLRWGGKRVFLYREQKLSICGDPWYQQLLALYDQILIPHESGEVDLPCPEHIPVKHTGPMLIRDRHEALERNEARQRLNLPQDRLILYVGFGGGGDLNYQKLLTWILEQATHYPQWLFVCPITPLSQDDRITVEPDSPIEKSLPDNIQTIRHYPMAECWRAFDGAISAAGYNSVTELLHHHVPTIWVPLERQADQQDLRVQRIIEENAGWSVAPFDGEALKQSLDALSDRKQRAQVQQRIKAIAPRNNGAKIAAEYLQQWLVT